MNPDLSDYESPALSDYATDPGCFRLLFGFTADGASISGFVRVSGFQFLRVDSHVFTVLLVLIFALASTLSDIIAHFKILGCG